MRFQNGSNKVAIELRVVQFWSEIILVISNRTRDFEITRMISDQIALHSVQLPLYIAGGGFPSQPMMYFKPILWLQDYRAENKLLLTVWGAESNSDQRINHVMAAPLRFFHSRLYPTKEAAYSEIYNSFCSLNTVLWNVICMYKINAAKTVTWQCLYIRYT